MMPSVGMIVHYHVRRYGRQGEDSVDVRAAIITHVWSDTLVNLAVFRDVTLDGVTPLEPKSAVARGREIGEWEWPEG